VGNPAHQNVFIPGGASADGTIVVGYSDIVDGSPQGHTWRAIIDGAGQYFSVAENDVFSTATAISPNGRYIGAYGGFLENGEIVGAAFVNDWQGQVRRFLQDENGNLWNAIVADVTDDGRVAVGHATALTHPQGEPPHGAFIAVDGVAQPFDAWLASEFALHDLNLEIATTVYVARNQYHFAAQSAADGKAYYITIPVARLDAVPGDFDGDSDVDGADFLVWQRTQGTSAGLAPWRANYGRTAGGAVSRMIPEGNGSRLMGIGAALFALLGKLPRLAESRAPRPCCARAQPTVGKRTT
jgi:hypothetical protein